MKLALKTEAIGLRQQGLTYSEILKKIPVAKSTLSLWLRSVQLSKRQEQIYSEKKRLAGLRGGLARKTERTQRQQEIMDLSRSEITEISKRDLWLMGIMLYWAEGAKEKNYRTGARVKFSNSDPQMIRIFLLWVKLSLKIPNDEVSICLYIHETHKRFLPDHLQFWKNVVGVGYNTDIAVYFKRNKPSTKRRKTGSNYHGQLEVNVKKSVDLNRKIAGWVEGVCLRCPIV